MSDAAPRLREFFTADHRSCDALWADVEAAADRGASDDIAEPFRRFDAAMRRHLQMEEDVLFPAFEEATGMTQGGPTFVMRSEHAQMRGVLDQMASAVTEGDAQEVLDLGDTLLMLIQQHNQKEERMLYPMADDALADQWPDLHERLGTL
jgi:hemerythrin-like domain-containing protein